MQANLVYCTGLYVYFFLVDNYNVKTNLICNESLFHQTNIVKTQMHCLYVRTGEFQTLCIFLHQANRTLNQLIMFVIYKIVSEYDQEIPQSQTADNPVASRGRAAQPSRDTRKTNYAKQPALSSPSR